jgi:colanic acid/amylovoran biosynthesis glycosyltransferase
MNSVNSADHPWKSREKPKIAMVVPAFPSVSQTFIALQIAWLYKLGYDLRIVRMGAAGDERWIVDALRPVLDKIDIISLPYNNTNSIFKRIFYFLPVWAANTRRMPAASFRVFLEKAMRLKLAEFVRIHNDAHLFHLCGNADILHFQFMTLANRYTQMQGCGFVRRPAGIVCSVRGYDISRKAVLDEIDFRALIQNVSLFLPVCEYFKKILEKNGFQKTIRVVHSPVDTTRLCGQKKVKGQKSSIKIVSVGRLVEKKGFDDAIKALSILRQSYSDFHYTIVGEGPLRRMLSGTILEYGLSGQVALKGEMPSRETLDLIAASDILIAPSKTAADGEVEGIPNVLKEAMCLGLQVIATKHAGIPELIEHKVNGLLVSEGSPEEIAHALSELIHNRSDWAGRAEKASMTVSDQYSPDQTTRDLIDAYETILNAKETKQP